MKEITIDGITYTIDTEDVFAVASVSKADENLSGAITIADVINDDGFTYVVTSIAEYAFAHCAGITSIVIPESVTALGGSAFEGCTNLTTVTLPGGLTYMGTYLFYNCPNLTAIRVPKGAKETYSKIEGLEPWWELVQETEAED